MIPTDSIPQLEPISNVVGYWTIGILKGVAIVIVPIALFSLGTNVIGKVITKSGGK